MSDKITLRHTTDLKMPKKNDGTIDNRYSMPQFVNKDGSKAKRTTHTNNLLLYLSLFKINNEIIKFNVRFTFTISKYFSYYFLSSTFFTK